MDETDRERIVRLEAKHDATYSLLQRIDKKMDHLTENDAEQTSQITGLKKDVGWIKKIGATVLGAGGAGGLWTWFTR